MEEENQQQVKQEPQRVKQEPQRVTTKDPKKVEAGKRLAAINCKKREAKKREEQAQLERGFTSGMNQYYGIGAVISLGVIGGLGLFIYRTKKVLQSEKSQCQSPNNHALRITSLIWIKSLLYYKNGQEEHSK